MKKSINKYFVGDIGFTTKELCKKYVRNIIYDLGICEIDEKHEKFNFIMDVLNNHPERFLKIGSGVKSFNIQYDFFNNLQIKINRIDDTEEIFSWIYCCNFKLSTNDELLTAAMRFSIKDDTIKYKREQQHLICSICSINNAIFHTDHYPIKFRDIKKDFLITNKLKIPEKFIKCEKTQITIFSKEKSDIEFNEAWYNFHHKNATYRILCKTCNLCEH